MHQCGAFFAGKPNHPQYVRDVAEFLAMLRGEKFVRGYVAVKRAEHENFKRVISSWEREFLLLSV